MAGARTSWRTSWMRLQGQLMTCRKASPMSQDDVAAKLGISRRTFQRWENGQTVPDAMELFRWADVLGIEISSECVTDGAPADGVA